MSLVGLVGFGTVVLLAMLVLHSYLWWRLVRQHHTPRAVRRGPDRAHRGARRCCRRWRSACAGPCRCTRAAPLDWVAYSWLGIAFYLFLTLLVLEPVRARACRPSGRGGRPAGDAAGCPRRRRRHRAPPRRVFLAAEPRRDRGRGRPRHGRHGRVHRQLRAGRPSGARSPCARLDPALDGLRIVTFSDAHLSATYGGRRFERLVEIVNAQRPDVVAIVGDLVDGSVAELRRGRRPAGRPGQRAGRLLRHRQPRVLRRHPGLAAAPAHAGRATCCTTSGCAIRAGTASFDLAGIDDRTAASSGVPGQGADLDAALDGRDDGTPVVLLAHQPVMVEQARAAGVDLQLSGHTHGGQLWPFDYVIRLDQPAVEGCRGTATPSST